MTGETPKQDMIQKNHSASPQTDKPAVDLRGQTVS